MSQSLNVSVWRSAGGGSFSTYEVPRQDSQTVLDVVTYIQRRLEPSLAYRFACPGRARPWDEVAAALERA